MRTILLAGATGFVGQALGERLVRAGFRVRVVHCWWTFADLETMSAALGDLFPATGAAVAGTLRRPRVSFKVAVYHRAVEQP